MAQKKCPNCGRNITGHKNKRFCGSKCKDRFHNLTNPRGYYEHLNQNSPNHDPLRDMHPFDSDNFN